MAWVMDPIWAHPKWLCHAIFNLDIRLQYLPNSFAAPILDQQLGLSLSRQAAMQCPKDSTTDDIVSIGKALVAYVHEWIAHLRLERGVGCPFIGKSWQPPKVMALSEQLLPNTSSYAH